MDFRRPLTAIINIIIIVIIIISFIVIVIIIVIIIVIAIAIAIAIISLLLVSPCLCHIMAVVPVSALGAVAWNVEWEREDVEIEEGVREQQLVA